MDPLGDATDLWAAPDSPVPNAPGQRTHSAGPGVSFGEYRPEPPPVPMPLRPMTMSDIVDGAFNIVKLRPGPILAASAVMTIPVSLVSAYTERHQLGTLFTTNADGTFSGTFGSAGGDAISLVFLLSLLPLPFLGAFMGRYVAEWYAGNDPNSSAIYRIVLGKTHTLLGAFVLVHLLEPFGLVVFALPLLLVVAPVIGIEDRSAIAAIRRSSQLGGRRYGPLLLVVITSFAVSLFLGWAFVSIPSVIGDSLGPETGWIVVGVGTSLGQLIAAPVVVGIAVMAYIDLRIRTEGLDLELRAQQIFASR